MNETRQVGFDENGRHLPVNEERKFLAKVIKCSSVNYWYRDRIGVEYIVDEHEDGEHYRNTRQLAGLFEKEDMEIIKQIKNEL